MLIGSQYKPEAQASESPRVGTHSLARKLHERSQTVRCTGFSRHTTIPPKGGTTNGANRLMQFPIALRVCTRSNPYAAYRGLKQHQRKKAPIALAMDARLLICSPASKRP